jgi:hypothetical protein
MARGRTPVEVWMGTPDEVHFCPPIYPVRLYFLWKERELKALVFWVFFSPEGRLRNLLN